MAETQLQYNNPSTSRTLVKHAVTIGSTMVLGLVFGLICHAFGDVIIYKAQ